MQTTIQLLVLAGIAIFLILKLRSVLGTREGFEKPPLPADEVRPRVAKRDFEVIEGGPDRDITDHVPDGSPAAKALAAMKMAEPGFSVNTFLQGARGAYELIVMAFERGDIKAIETRREIYGGTLAPVLLRGARILTKDGRSIQLGYLNEANVDPAFPYIEIADRIASRAGLQIVDRGAVRRNVATKMMGIRAMDDGGGPIDEAVVADLNRRHAHVVIGLVAGLVVLIGIGIAGDLMTERDAVSGQPPAKDVAPKRK